MLKIEPNGIENNSSGLYGYDYKSSFSLISNKLYFYLEAQVLTDHSFLFTFATLI